MNYDSCNLSARQVSVVPDWLDSGVLTGKTCFATGNIFSFLFVFHIEVFMQKNALSLSLFM